MRLAQAPDAQKIIREHEKYQLGSAIATTRGTLLTVGDGGEVSAFGKRVALSRP